MADQNKNLDAAAGASQEQIDRLLALQEKEVVVYIKQLDAELASQTHSFELSKRSFEINAEDRKDQRRFIFRIAALVLIAVLSMLGIAGAAVYLKEFSLAKEIVIALISLAAGAVGGYGLGRMQQKDA